MTLAEIKPFSQDIINSYIIDKMSTYEIAKKYDCYSSTIVNLLKQFNVSRRNYVEASKTIYTIDETFFDKIDTEEKAYILGFMFTDGNNNPNNRSTSITLRLDDREILEKIRIAMKSNAPLKKYKGRILPTGYKGKPQISFRISNSHIRNSLFELGVTSNKTYTTQIPFDKIPKELMPHFIRGVFDGDGSIYTLSQNKNKPAVEIVGSCDFVKGIKDFLLEENIECHFEQFKQEKANTNIGRIYIYRNNMVESFLKYIYKDSTIYMERKYKRYYDYYYNNIPITKYETLSEEQMLEKYGYEDIIPQYDD